MKARGLETRRKRERGAASRVGVARDAEAVVGGDPAAGPTRSWAEAERHRRGRADIEPRGALLRATPGARARGNLGVADPGDRALDPPLPVDERSGVRATDVAALDISLRPQ